MAIDNRRVVTGLDAEGRSCVLFDAPLAPGPNPLVKAVWRAPRVPADNSGGTDTGGGDFGLDDVDAGGSTFSIMELPPSDEPAMMHATNTLDYLIVLRGKVLLVLETEEVVLGPGDIIIDRGVLHGWKCAGDEPVLVASITIPAEPLGAGARILP